MKILFLGGNLARTLAELLMVVYIQLIAAC